MVQYTKVLFIDDLDGGAADQTVVFGLDGKSYEIDLSTRNAQLLRDALGLFVDNARKVQRATASSGYTRSAKPTSKSEPNQRELSKSEHGNESDEQPQRAAAPGDLFLAVDTARPGQGSSHGQAADVPPAQFSDHVR